MESAVEVAYVEVPGARLWTASQGVGTPLVLCHGGPGLSDNLGPLAVMIDDIARVHRFDQRGGGRSSTGCPLDVDTLVADLDALRGHWGHERWVVGGHSNVGNSTEFHASNVNFCQFGPGQDSEARRNILSPGQFRCRHPSIIGFGIEIRAVDIDAVTTELQPGDLRSIG